MCFSRPFLHVRNTFRRNDPVDQATVPETSLICFLMLINDAYLRYLTEKEVNEWIERRAWQCGFFVQPSTFKLLKYFCEYLTIYRLFLEIFPSEVHFEFLSSSVLSKNSIIFGFWSKFKRYLLTDKEQVVEYTITGKKSTQNPNWILFKSKHDQRCGMTSLLSDMLFVKLFRNLNKKWNDIVCYHYLWIYEEIFEI